MSNVMKTEEDKIKQSKRGTGAIVTKKEDARKNIATFKYMQFVLI